MLSSILFSAAACVAPVAVTNGVMLSYSNEIEPAHDQIDKVIYQVPDRTVGPDDGGLTAQAWAMLGREDIAAKLGSSELVPTGCLPSDFARRGWSSVRTAILSEASRHKVLIINESHWITRHRGIIIDLLPDLRALGYSTYAAEAFTNLQGHPSPIEQHSSLPWPHWLDGYYTREPVFGRLVRIAKNLGYRTLAYEHVQGQKVDIGISSEFSVSMREATQARNIFEIVQTLGKSERLLIHAGYSHASETLDTKVVAMAAVLKHHYGIDPLTISQTSCRSADNELQIVDSPNTLAIDSYDIIISHPIETYTQGRPSWRLERGDVAVPIPPALRPSHSPVVIEAFAFDEPGISVPIDRIFVRPGEARTLLLPPGHYRLRSIATKE